MSKTTSDDRQWLHRNSLSRLSGAPSVEGDDIIESINEEMTPPLDMLASATPDLVLNVGSIEKANTLTGLNRSIPPINDIIPSFSSGTITLPATSGGNIVTSVGADPVLTISDDSFLKIGVNLNENGEFELAFGTEGASLAAATNPPSINKTYAIGYIVARTVGSAVQNVENSDIYQYVGGGSGGGGGGLEPVFTASDTPTAEIGKHFYLQNANTDVTVSIGDDLFEEGAVIAFTPVGSRDSMKRATILQPGTKSINGKSQDYYIHVPIGSTTTLTADFSNDNWVVTTDLSKSFDDGEVNYLREADVDTTGELASITPDLVSAGDADGWVGESGNQIMMVTESNIVRGYRSLIPRNSSAAVQELYADFEVPEADKNKLLKVEFDYKALGSYTDGDWSIAVHKDPTGTNDEILAPVEIPATEGVFSASWVSEGADTYRLKFVSANKAILDANSIAVDRIIVGPGTINSGAVVGRWESYAGSLTNVSTSEADFEYRRVGENIEVAATAIVTSVSGDIILSLPPGLSIDVDKVSSASSDRYLNGTAFAKDISNGASSAEGIPMADTSTQIKVRMHNNSAFWQNTLPFTWASPDQLAIRFTAPITEWAGSGILNVLDSGVINSNSRLSYTKDDAQQFHENGSTVIIYNDAEFDESLGQYNSSTGEYTATSDQVVQVDAGISFDGGTGTDIKMYIRVDGTILRRRTNTNAQDHVTISSQVKLLEGEVLTVTATNGVNNETNSTVADFNWLQISTIPSISANEPVGFGLATAENPGLVKKPNGTIRLDSPGVGAAGHGTVGTRIRRFTNSETSGDGFTYADDAAQGMTVTVNQDCIAAISYTDDGNSELEIGITFNAAGSSDPNGSGADNRATSVAAVPTSQRLIMTRSEPLDHVNVSATFKFNAGDVIRAHTNGNATESNNQIQFLVQEIFRL